MEIREDAAVGWMALIKYQPGTNPFYQTPVWRDDGIEDQLVPPSHPTLHQNTDATLGKLRLSFCYLEDWRLKKAVSEKIKFTFLCKFADK